MYVQWDDVTKTTWLAKTDVVHNAQLDVCAVQLKGQSTPGILCLSHLGTSFPIVLHTWKRETEDTPSTWRKVCLWSSWLYEPFSLVLPVYEWRYDVLDYMVALRKLHWAWLPTKPQCFSWESHTADPSLRKALLLPMYAMTFDSSKKGWSTLPPPWYIWAKTILFRKSSWRGLYKAAWGDQLFGNKSMRALAWTSDWTFHVSAVVQHLKSKIGTQIWLWHLMVWSASSADQHRQSVLTLWESLFETVPLW
jgi:hypothetical protein